MKTISSAIFYMSEWQATRFWVPLFHNGHIIGRVVVKQ